MTWSQEAAARIAQGESTYRQEAERVMHQVVEALPTMTPDQAARAANLGNALMREVEMIELLESLGSMFRSIHTDTQEEGTWTSTDGSGP